MATLSYSNMAKKKKQHIVGIKIDTTKDSHGQAHKKTYYYSTDKDLKKGDKVHLKVPSGGHPRHCTVVVADSKKDFSGRIIKELKEQK